MSWPLPGRLASHTLLPPRVTHHHLQFSSGQTARLLATESIVRAASLFSLGVSSSRSGVAGSPIRENLWRSRSVWPAPPNLPASVSATYGHDYVPLDRHLLQETGDEAFPRPLKPPAIHATLVQSPGERSIRSPDASYQRAPCFEWLWKSTASSPILDTTL